MPESTLKVEALAQPLALETSRLAVGMKMATLQYFAQVATDEQAPHFLPAQEPLQDAQVYSSTSGQQFYRPMLRVAQRKSGLPGPEVRFLKDANNKVFLQFELEESPLPNGGSAEPLNVKVEGLQLRWTDSTGQLQTRHFGQPSLIATNDPQDPSKANFALRIGAELTPEEVQPLYGALSQPTAGAVLQVDFSFGYWLDEDVVVTPEPTGPRPHSGIFSGIFLRPELLPLLVQPREETVLAPMLLRNPAIFRPEFVQPAEPVATVAEPLLSVAATLEPTVLEAVRLEPKLLKFSPEVLEIIKDKEAERQRQPNFRTAQFSRSLPFTFPENLEANAPIYAAIVSQPVLDQAWTGTDFGVIKPAAFPNTIYRLPDEVRLAYSPELRTPYMMPSLYRDDRDEVKVRVVLRALPWHDPDKLVRLRDHLRKASHGAFASPAVVVGGYEKATLKFTGAFPDQIRIMGEEEVEVSLESGFQVTLDLSLEFYKFLVDLLTGPVGLTGEINVVIESQPQEGVPAQTQEKRIPVRLNFDDLAALPLEIRLPEEAVSPRQLTLHNPITTAMKIGPCIPRLLQVDSNSVVPLEVFEARTKNLVFPLTLAPQSDLLIELEPQDETVATLWNAVQVEVLSQELTQGGRAALERIHEVAPQNTLAWKLGIECPLFTQPLPERFKNLFSVRVKLARPGFAPQMITLKPTKATETITMQRTLREIVGQDAQSSPSYKYQVQNIYLDHEGRWGAERETEGDLVVFPNDPNND
jgi:hypothetical protein